MKIREDRLEKKGWTSEEIAHAKEIIAKAESEKSKRRKLHEELLLWLFLIIVSAATMTGAWIMQPLLLSLNTNQALITLGVIGLLFGTFSAIIIKELEELETHHHLFLTISIPLVAVITSVLISQRVEKMAQLTALTIAHHNPLALAIVYTLSTICAYSITLYIEGK